MFKRIFSVIIFVTILWFNFPTTSFAAVGDYTGTTFDTGASGAGNPYAITFYNDFFWITDAVDYEVYKYNPDGTYANFSFDLGANHYPWSIAGYGGFLWIANSGNSTIEKYNLDGTYTGVSFDVSGTGFSHGMVAYNDFFWIVNDTSDEVWKYNPDGTYTGVHFDTAASGNGNPHGITVYGDAFWIADWLDREVYKFSSDGTYTTVHFDTAASGNGAVFSITTYNDFFWVLDQTDTDIYKYFATSDVTAPLVSTLSPTDGAIDVAVASNLVITFDEAVNVGTGNITIYKSSDDSIIEAIDVTGGLVTGTGTTTITVNPTSNLAEGTDYYIQIDATAFDDTSGNSFAGILDETTWNFTTIDATGPVISETTPVTASGTDTTPDYTFTTDEAGDITYGGSCASATTTAVIGANTITFNTLVLGTYTDCTVTVTDAASNDSNILAVTSFTITAPASGSSSGSRPTILRKSIPVLPQINFSTDTDGCTASYLYSPKTGAKCPEVSTPTPVAPSCILTQTLKQGSTGDEVKCLQTKLKITSDGIFGPKTKESVMTFQKLKNLIPDGIVGPKTRVVVNTQI
ncbi:MAG: large repetitive protein [Patescibacteria group bacterium]|nr:large repetitive protein [Patescibacteria group bacterium]